LGNLNVGCDVILKTLQITICQDVQRQFMVIVQQVLQQTALHVVVVTTEVVIIPIRLTHLTLHLQTVQVVEVVAVQVVEVVADHLEV
jgi:hypothetical protein